MPNRLTRGKAEVGGLSIGGIAVAPDTLDSFDLGQATLNGASADLSVAVVNIYNAAHALTALKTDYVAADVDTAAEIATALNAINTRINLGLTTLLALLDKYAT